MPLPPEYLSHPQEYRLEYFPNGEPPSQRTLSFYQAENERLFSEAAEYWHSWREHIQNSQAFILDSAQGLKGKAVIFGLGNGLDIPLEQLAERFDYITAVDIDFNSAHRAIIALPLGLQRKFTVRIDDLTGAVLPLARELGPAMKRRTKPPDILHRAATFAENFQAKPYPLADTYDFAVSSLTTSYLTSQLTDYVAKGAMTPKEFAAAQNSLQMKDFKEASVTLLRRITKAHIDTLADTVKPEGRVYLADTMIERGVSRNPETQELELSSGPFFKVDPPQYVGAIDERFTVLRNEGWNWYKKPPFQALTAPTRGFGYEVQAANLQKK